MEKHRVAVRSRLPAVGRVLDIGQLRRSVRSVLDAEGVDKPCQVNILLTTDAEIRSLNRVYRDIDRPTDVLSFPLLDLTPGVFNPSAADIDRDTGRTALGDIVISVDRIREQARRFGHSVDRETGYLVVHSTLHLLGYDHLDEGPDKRKMRAREKEIVGEMGFAE